MLGRYSSEAASIGERSVNGSPIWALFPFRHWLWDFEQVTSQEHPFPDLENWTSWIIFLQTWPYCGSSGCWGNSTDLASVSTMYPSITSVPSTSSVPSTYPMSCIMLWSWQTSESSGMRQTQGCFPAHNLCVAHFAGLTTSLVDTIFWLKVPNLAWGRELLVLPESFIPEAFIKGLL